MNEQSWVLPNSTKGFCRAKRAKVPGMVQATLGCVETLPDTLLLGLLLRGLLFPKQLLSCLAPEQARLPCTGQPIKATLHLEFVLS